MTIVPTPKITRLTPNDRLALIKQLAATAQIDPILALAVFAVESAGNGFRPSDGRLTIRLEPHVVCRLAPKCGITPAQIPWSEVTATSQKRLFENLGWSYNAYKTLNYVCSIHEELGYLSTSYGCCQVLGTNHNMLEYSSAKSLYMAFHNESNQILGFFDYCKNRKGMMAALQSYDFNLIAGYYNGFSTQQKLYASKIEKQYNKLKGA